MTRVKLSIRQRTCTLPPIWHEHDWLRHERVQFSNRSKKDRLLTSECVDGGKLSGPPRRQRSGNQPGEDCNS